MSSRHKEQTKQLKAADPLQVRLAQALAWLVKNTRVLVIALIPVAVAAAGFFGWRYFQTQQRNARVEELGKVQVVYEREQTKANDEREAIMKKAEALEAKINPPPPPAAKPGEPATPAVPPDPAAAL